MDMGSPTCARSACALCCCVSCDPPKGAFEAEWHKTLGERPVFLCQGNSEFCPEPVEIVIFVLVRKSVELNMLKVTGNV